MAVTGPPEWRPTVFWRIFGGFWLGSRILRLLVLTGDLVDLVLAVLSLGFGIVALAALAPYRVRVDGRGVRVRGLGWRTTWVAWTDLTDIRPRRPDRPRDPLVVVTRDGRELRTMLDPVEHRSLPQHWRCRAGLPEPT